MRPRERLVVVVVVDACDGGVASGEVEKLESQLPASKVFALADMAGAGVARTQRRRQHHRCSASYLITAHQV